MVGAQHRFVLGHRLAEAEARGEADQAVEAAQLRRQRLHQVGDVVGRAGVLALGLGDRDLGDVDPDRVDPVVGEGGDEAAEAAAGVEHAVARLDAEQLHRQRRLLLVALVAAELVGDPHVGGPVGVDLVEDWRLIAHGFQSVPRAINPRTGCRPAGYRRPDAQPPAISTVFEIAPPHFGDRPGAGENGFTSA